jgi:hypothetical protein
MKIRKGVLNSQWAGECGESFEECTDEDFADFTTACKDEADENKDKDDLKLGAIINVELSGTDPDALEVMEVQLPLVVGSSEYDDWCCENCCSVAEDDSKRASDNGCAACNDGFKFGDDRFVVRHGPKRQPYICIIRYYEMHLDDEEHNEADDPEALLNSGMKND